MGLTRRFASIGQEKNDKNAEKLRKPKKKQTPTPRSSPFPA
jgi:hypothetical protein